MTSSKSAPPAEQAFQRPADSFLLMRAKDRRQQGAGQGGDPSLGDRNGLVGDAVLQAGQFGHHQSDIQVPERVQRQRTGALTDQQPRRPTARFLGPRTG